MTVIKEILLLFAFVITALIVSSQDMNEQWIVDFPGKLTKFKIGHPLPAKIPVSLSFRADSLIAKSLVQNGIEFSINYPSTEGNSESNNYFNQAYVKFIGQNKVEVNGSVLIDSKILNLRLDYKRAMLLGRVNLNSSSIKKLEHIDFSAEMGYPNLSDFKKIKHISTQNITNKYVYVEPIPLQNGFGLKYPGDPFLIKKISQLAYLSTLNLNFPTDHSYMNYSGNVYFIDGIPESTFSNEQLNSVTLSGVDFLPVVYKDLEHINYLDVSNIPTPEIFNIVIRFHELQRDTSEGTWSYLLQYIDIEKSSVSSENGFVRTFYKNGIRISEGEMVNNQPNGIWKFWYPDGKLCEERQYKNGQRTGDWVFRAPTGVQPDTILVLRYDDGKLIYRKDISFDYVPFHPNECRSAEIRTHVAQISEYNLVWKGDDSVEINKTMTVIARDLYNKNKLSDTLKGYIENWNFNKSEWNYSCLDFCIKENVQLFSSYQGRLGQVPNRAESAEITLENETVIKKYIRSVDLNNCTWETVIHRINSDTNILDEIERKKNSIAAEDWPCNQ